MREKCLPLETLSQRVLGQLELQGEQHWEGWKTCNMNKYIKYNLVFELFYYQN